jgi:hypothetical protein
MKRRLLVMGVIGLAALFTLAGPARAQQTFGLSDLQGGWDVYVYGGYDAFTESFFGSMNLNEAGGLLSGMGYWRGTESFFINPSQLILNPGGDVSGTLRCEHVTWNLVYGRMSQRKTEITAMADGSRFFVLIRMVKSTGEAADDPDAVSPPPADETPEEEDPPAEEEDPPAEEEDSGGSGGSGGSSGPGSAVDVR